MYRIYRTYKTVRPKKARTADHKVQSQLQSSSLHIAQFVDHIGAKKRFWNLKNDRSFFFFLHALKAEFLYYIFQTE